MLDDAAFEGQVFDEAFFAYKEDVDLAWRARWLGWEAWYEPAAQAEHHRTFRPGRRERGSAFTRRLSVRNRYLLLLKNEAPATWRRDWPAILAYDALILAYLLVREPASLAGLAEAWRLRPVMRRDVQYRSPNDSSAMVRLRRAFQPVLPVPAATAGVCRLNGVHFGGDPLHCQQYVSQGRIDVSDGC